MVSWSYRMLFSVLTRLVARWWAAPASHTEWRIYRTAGDSRGAPGKAWSGFHSDEAELSPPAAAKRWIVRKKNKQMTSPPPSPNKNSKKSMFAVTWWCKDRLSFSMSIGCSYNTNSMILFRSGMSGMCPVILCLNQLNFWTLVTVLAMSFQESVFGDKESSR